MKSFDWIQSYPHCVTVCDTEGIIIAMNRAAADNFKKYGGNTLTGTSLFDCHPESANRIIRDLLARQRGTSYITTNANRKRLVNQVPWYRDDVFSGLVETIIDLPQEIRIKKK